MATSVFELPEYKIGPYRMKVIEAPKERFADKRYAAESDWCRNEVMIRTGTKPRDALKYFLRHLITAIHYRSGLNDKSDEESFTHSISTGFVEVALNNHEFWIELNQLFEHLLKPDSGWGVAARAVKVTHGRPRMVSFGDELCKVNFLKHKIDGGKVYGHYYKKGKHSHAIDLSSELDEAHMLLIIFHEIFHFLHASVGLKDKDNETTFKRTQVNLFVRFIIENPEFWTWWLQAVGQLRSKGNSLTSDVNRSS